MNRSRSKEKASHLEPALHWPVFWFYNPYLKMGTNFTTFNTTTVNKTEP